MCLGRGGIQGLNWGPCSCYSSQVESCFWQITKKLLQIRTTMKYKHLCTPSMPWSLSGLEDPGADIYKMIRQNKYNKHTGPKSLPVWPIFSYIKHNFFQFIYSHVLSRLLHTKKIVFDKPQKQAFRGYSVPTIDLLMHSLNNLSPNKFNHFLSTTMNANHIGLIFENWSTSFLFTSKAPYPCYTNCLLVYEYILNIFSPFLPATTYGSDPLSWSVLFKGFFWIFLSVTKQDIIHALSFCFLSTPSFYSPFLKTYLSIQWLILQKLVEGFSYLKSCTVLGIAKRFQMEVALPMHRMNFLLLYFTTNVCRHNEHWQPQL